MRRYTTPTIIVRIEGADLTGCDVYLTFRQGRREVTVTEFEGMEVGENATSLALTLTQLQTAGFDESKPVEVQANVVDYNQYRAASDIKEVTFGRQLLEREREHA